MPFYVGTSVKLSATFTVDNVATDPSSITLSLRGPNGTTTSYTYASAQLTKDGTGVFSRNVTLDAEGHWDWRFVGTGSVVAAQEGGIDVEPSIFV